MSVWFSASAVVPVLKARYGIGGGQAAALSSSVALGFVAGTLLSALLGLADRLIGATGREPGVSASGSNRDRGYQEAVAA